MEPCPSTNTIAELVCRQLDGAKALEVESHVSVCATCRRLVGTLAAASLPHLGHGSEPHVEASDRAPAREPHRYEIREELARGGMGRISIAFDTLLGRTVAIKELLAPRTELATRFRRELALTSRLQHPSIVSIHDAGTWSTGEPFYVMRLVSGEPLDRVIARADHAAARIALLPNAIAMVDALAYAHSQGVIHRDLKPANVLVGDFGETVVIDWGLAKDLRDVATPEPASGELADPGATVAGLVVGTPAYMPPEQARGGEVDERSDVYALGAVLYHLFSGAAPYAGATATAIVNAVAAGAPPPLAERAAGIPRDLLTIVAKAMARAPGDRYATAGELAIDLKRFQSGQLVGAHHYSSWQLARRWIRKHRTAVAVGAVAIVALAVVGFVGVRRVLAEQRIAEQHRADADQLMTFMVMDLHDKLKPLGKLDLLGAVAHKARDYYRDHWDDRTTADRVNRYFALENLGEVLEAQGDPTAAIVEFREALLLAEVLEVEDPTDLIRRGFVSTSHSRIGSVLMHQLDAAAAISEFRLSLAMNQSIVDADPTNSKMSVGLAFDHDRLGEVLDAQGDTAGALEHYRAALELSKTFAAREPSNTSWLEQLSEAHGDIAEALRKGEDNAGSVAENRAALEISNQLVRREPDNGEWQMLTVNYHIRTGQGLEEHDLAGALAEYRAAFATARTLVARDATNDVWQRDLALSQTQIGVVLLAQGDTAHALEAFRAALVSEQAVVTASPSNVAALRMLLRGHDAVGHALIQANDSKAALAEYQTCLAIAVKIAAEDSTNVASQADLATIRNNVGLMLAQLGSTGPALEQFRAAAAGSKAIADRDPNNADARHELCGELNNVGDALLAQGDGSGALAQYRASEAVSSALLIAHPADPDAEGALYDSHDKIGDQLAVQHAIIDALVEDRAALAIIEKLVAQLPTVAIYQGALVDCHTKIGDLLSGQGDAAGALAEYRAALPVAEGLARLDSKDADRAKAVAALRAKVGQ